VTSSLLKAGVVVSGSASGFGVALVFSAGFGANKRY
jgi:hypothetical protein